MMLNLVAYLASATVLFTYFRSTRGGTIRAFHWANFLGCFPLIMVEFERQTYPPMVLTIAFGIIGFLGLTAKP